MALAVHLVQYVAGLQSDRLCDTYSSAIVHGNAALLRTSIVTLSFMAKSPSPSSSVRPMIMPRILGSARGERLPEDQQGRGLSADHAAHFSQQLLAHRAARTDWSVVRDASKHLGTHQVRVEVHVLGQVGCGGKPLNITITKQVPQQTC